ncbi:MAG: OmpA family protein [Prevotella sp.]|nr:OmpA family protein [Prevotella sp.]
MKRLFTLMAAGLVAASMSAQTVTESKTFDNVYIGINGGVATKTTGHAWLKGLNPNAGLRIGRYFTPVFGLAVESNAYFSNKPWQSVGTTVRALNTSLLGTVNLSNWFGGYKGEPRAFEVSALYGFGWGHVFGQADKYVGSDFKATAAQNATAGNQNIVKSNSLTSKAALDFAFNLGESKAWQIYIEPAIIWGLNGLGYEGVEYNVNKSFVQLNAGLVYKFKNSNGTHNFTIAQLRDQAEIDALNSTINDLRNELAKKPKEVVKEVVKEAPAPQEVKVENLVFVTFAQGKADLTKDAKKALDGVTSGKHVQIVGTASPEGSKEINDKLSQARADVVANYLKANGVVIDEATGKGVQGTTSNRLAVVYVK